MVISNVQYYELSFIYLRLSVSVVVALIIICFSHLPGPTGISAINTAKGK